MDFSILISWLLEHPGQAPEPLLVWDWDLSSSEPLWRDTDSEPKDGNPLGEIPAWFDQVISFKPNSSHPEGWLCIPAFPKHSIPKKPANTAQRKSPLLPAHSLLNSGGQGELWRSKIQPHSSKSQLNIPFIPGSPQAPPEGFAAHTELFPSKKGGKQEGAFPMGLGMRELWDHPNLSPSAAPHCPSEGFL